MVKIDRKLAAVIERYIDYEGERKLFQSTLHDFHYVAAELEVALKTKWVQAFTSEEREYHRQEKKLHFQADHFDRSLSRYRKALLAAGTLVNRSVKVVYHGVTYQIRRKGKELTVTIE